ncbi:MAG TPA: FAD-dependent monooxygenase, partial [Gemmataceae bacterium]|nr:FAD-dependent monooxygenase [Gemmataceae bacterium]
MPPTLTPTEAADRAWDCAVLGAGPAGALTAREVARRGARVLLLDRAAFPRYKVCGCCLNPRALGVLDRVGLGSLVPRLGGVRLNRLRLGAGRAKAGLPLPAGAAVSRTAFDTALIREAIAAGAAFLPLANGSVEPTASGGAVRRVQVRHAAGPVTVEARVVVAATGLGGRVDDEEAAWRPGSRIGAGVVVEDAPAEYVPHAIHMA